MRLRREAVKYRELPENSTVKDYLTVAAEGGQVLNWCGINKKEKGYEQINGLYSNGFWRIGECVWGGGVFFK